MFVTSKDTELPFHSSLLGDKCLVWPMVEIAFNSDVLAVRLSSKHDRKMQPAPRSFFVDLEHCGELLSLFIAQGAVIEQAAILRIKNSAPPHPPLGMSRLKEIKIGKRSGFEEIVAIVETVAGDTLTLPSWDRGSTRFEGATIFLSKE